MKKRYIILLITGHTADSKRMRDLYIWAVSVAMSSILAACHTAPPHAIQSLSTVADATSIEQTIDATTLAALDNNTVAIVATPYGKDSIVGHQVVMDYYYLQANNIDELKAAIENRRADNPERKHFMANTSTRVRWNWDGYGQETCDLHTLRLSYDIVVTFPRWDTPEHLPDADKTAWVKFINDLATHEMGHIQVAYEQLPRMENASKPPTASPPTAMPAARWRNSDKPTTDTMMPLGMAYFKAHRSTHTPIIISKSNLIT